MNAQTERLTLSGPAGAIEALRDLPVPSPAAQVPDLLSADPNAAPGQEAAQPRGTAIICHPHPLFGGTMDNKVVQTLARALVQCGWTAVRFNFRGVGASAGSYDEGRGEADDGLAVVQQVAPTGPVVIAGFSFGAYVAAQTVAKLMPQRPPEAVVLVGTAASRFDVPAIAHELHGRTLVVHGEHDDTVPLAAVMDWARHQLLPVTVVPGGGHFFHGQLNLLKGLVVRHLLAH